MNTFSTHMILLVLCLHFLRTPSSANEAESTPISPTPQNLSKLIDDLESEDFQTRETATNKLAEMGAQIARPLKRALKGKTRSPEFTVRARRLLALHESEAVNGLRIVLSAEGREVEANQAIAIKLNLKNEGTNGFNLCVGWGSGISNYFRSGHALKFVTTEKTKPATPVGAISTGHGPVFEHLKAAGTLEYTISATFRMQTKGQARPRLEAPSDRDGHPVFLIPGPGKYRLQVSYAITDKDNRAESGLGLLRKETGSRNLAARDWTGTIRSNQVEFVVQAPKDP